MVEWTAQDFRYAQRLLRVLVERAEKRKTQASGGLDTPDKFDDPRQYVPASREGAAEPTRNANVRCTALNELAPPVAVAGRSGSNGCGMGGGRAASSSVETGVSRTNGCARPNPEDAIGADRAEYTLRRLR